MTEQAENNQQSNNDTPKPPLAERRAPVNMDGCAPWIAGIILAPAIFCILFALFGPTIRQNLAQTEANARCNNLPTNYDAVENVTIFTARDSAEAITSDTVITAENAEQLSLNTRIPTAEITPVRDRGFVEAVAHPQGEYAVYGIYQPLLATRFFICEDDGDARGAFTADETTGNVAFNPDGSLFAVGDGEFGRVVVFDGVEVERLHVVDIRFENEARLIDSVAFHPTEPLLFFASESALFVYTTGTTPDAFTQVARIDSLTTANREIGFNPDGTVVYLADPETGGQTQVLTINETN
ncbi:MAG: hypothetical protein AAFQ07_01545 [Chloroflexota bacterium]